MINGNNIECSRCSDELDSWAYSLKSGVWDKETQNYERRPNSEKFCRECWEEQEGRENGAQYWPETAAELYDVLAAANGNLVARLCWWSKRPCVRVVDGNIEGLTHTVDIVGEEADGTKVIEFEAEPIEQLDREKFDEIADPPNDMGLVVLTNPKQTEFASSDEDEQ